MQMPKQLFILTAFFLALAAQAVHGEFIKTELGSGGLVLASSGGGTHSGSVSFPTMTVDRAHPEFGNHTTAIEGVYYTYSFLAPSASNAAGKSRFDCQNQMSGLWSGWGDASNGPWQNGPTTATWNRGNRRQHVYPGGTPTSTFAGSPPAADPSVPVSTINQPDLGDLLQVSMYLNAIDNTLLTVFENLTKGESFQYLTTNPSLPTGNLSFNGISFRSDTSPLPMSYTYGTLLVVPEPSSLVLLAAAGLGCLWFRRRRR